VPIESALSTAVQTWIADDPDEGDRSELRALLDRAGVHDVAGTSTAAGEAAAIELRDRFAGRLTFGTAGLRGRIGAGPNRMNRAVVRAATAAVAEWLLAADAEARAEPAGQPPGGARPAGPRSDGPPSIVIGCDARHRSDEFADEAARVLAGAGIQVRLLPRPCPTPLLAFAVRHFGAHAGIMITASHNPAADNGYKLYLGDGAQIIPPVDAEIMDRIASLGPLADVRTADLGSPLITVHGDEVASAYLDAIAGPPPDAPVDAMAAPATPAAPAAGIPRAREGEAELVIVYTPMHGVAGGLMLRAIERAGFAAPLVVKAQAEPDPDFPTVAFPNPEEPGALDLALADAIAAGADLVLASDPDGDRLAVAVPGNSADGWRQLTGDQLGALLGSFVLRTENVAGGDPDPRVPLVATTIVSSTLLSKIAAAAGAEHEKTLTGFKWIARAADHRPGSRFVFGYEEALGYEIGQTVRDKDGIGAALAVLAMATAAKHGGRTLGDEYDELETRHGVHLTEQLSPRVPAPAKVIRGIRATPPAAFGGEPVTAMTDFTAAGTGLPLSDVLSFALPDARVVIRPSGTEPKIKAYLEVVEPVRQELAAARNDAKARAARIRAATEELLRPAD
jgi:phosphomannomutase